MPSLSRTFVLALGSFATLATAAVAHADPPSTTAATPAPAAADEICLASSIEGQVLRRSGRLLRARELFVECARDVCEKPMRERCALWRSEVEARTPHLSLRVNDDRGLPVPGAQLHVDGQEVTLAPGAATLLEVDPGKHVARANFAGRRELAEVDVTEGTRSLALTLDLRTRLDTRPTPALVYGLGATFGAAAIAFGIFGTSALVQAGHLGDCQPYCAADRKAPFDTAVVGSDVSAGLGAAALLGAVIVYLARPTVTREVRVSSRGVAWDF
jgi:hypothetical protein